MKIRITIGLLCFLLMVNHIMAQQQKSAKAVNLGPQITANMIQGSLFIHEDNGKDWIYTVVRGEPAHLLGYELTTGKLLLDKPLPKADGVWDMAYSTDGYLYIPGASGYLFRHKPGTQEVENLGLALEGETYVWNLTAGKDGEVFGATYPGCRVFRYHSNDGFSDAGRGALVEGENYVRSLAYHQKTGLLYAGIGSHAHLIELNPVTGEKKELLPAKYQEKEFVYALEIVPGANGNDRLFILLTSGRETLVYNLKTKKFEQEISNMDMKALAYSKNGKEVFYTSQSALMSFNPSKPIKTARQHLKDAGSANALSIKEGQLYLLTSDADLIKYNPKNGSAEKTKLEIPGQPIPINALMYGPDGKIWMGGYLAGGHATYNPETGENKEYKGLHQTEGMAFQGKDIYFGIYPKGRFYRYDTQKEWNIEDKNPLKIGEVEGQSRSFAVLSVESQRKMFFGMIPEYGKLGGAFVEYDIQSEKLHSYGEIVPKHAISSLVYTDNMVVGGTTISGGLGVKPDAAEAVLFGWNPVTKSKTFELVPVKGAPAITGLMNGPDGNIWGVAGGYLFIFNAVSKEIVETHKIYDAPKMGSHIWRSAFLVNHPSGDVYGTVNNKLFKISPSKTITFLHEGASLLTMDKDGNLYFRRLTDLWKYTP